MHRGYAHSSVASREGQNLGSSEADILRAYPILRAEDLTNAWAYFRANRDEIEQQIVENETA